MGRFQHQDYVEMTMHFRCNLKCEHCMIEGTMDRLVPESDDKLEALLQENATHQHWKGLILTGSEVTLRSDLPDLARRAKEVGGFRHVRIQTHGMKLANPRYCETLVDAGIDQYFVSVTAADAATHDRITKVPGSFEKTMSGLDNLDVIEGVTLLTNTVITQQCYHQLPQLVDRLGHLKRLAQMDFWNYFPMRETDDKELIVPHATLLPYLHHAIVRARQLGRDVDVKNFPECLLGSLRDALDNGQPQLFIDPSFWDEFMRNGFYQCIYRETCQSSQCLGLNTAYVQKYGWEADQLYPIEALTTATGMEREAC